VFCAAERQHWQCSRSRILQSRSTDDMSLLTAVYGAYLQVKLLQLSGNVKLLVSKWPNPVTGNGGFRVFATGWSCQGGMSGRKSSFLT
jgi:hypothetical protein